MPNLRSRFSMHLNFSPKFSHPRYAHSLCVFRVALTKRQWAHHERVFNAIVAANREQATAEAKCLPFICGGRYTGFEARLPIGLLMEYVTTLGYWGPSAASEGAG